MTLLEFCKQEASLLEKNGQLRTSKAYISAFFSLSQFLGRDAGWEDICPEVIQDYERYMNNKELSKNTISFYMRNLRVTRNKAIEQKIIKSSVENPFSGVFTGTVKTRKRALDSWDSKKLFDLAEMNRKVTAGITLNLVQKQTDSPPKKKKWEKVLLFVRKIKKWLKIYALKITS